MSQTIFYLTKDDFLAYCERIWNQGKEEGFQLIKAVSEKRGITVLGKRNCLKIKSDLLVSQDIFTRENTVHPLMETVIFPFVAIKRSGLKEDYKSKESEK